MLKILGWGARAPRHPLLRGPCMWTDLDVENFYRLFPKISKTFLRKFEVTILNYENQEYSAKAKRIDVLMGKKTAHTFRFGA